MDATTNISVIQCVSAHGPELPCMQADRWPQSYSFISMTVVCHNCLTHVLDNYVELVMLGQDLNIGRVTVIIQELGVKLPQIWHKYV